ncbi:hypothetical protein Bca52824_080707 [Brassica carinata]|uniref:Uncharacterized protein n=1 Tax=Brassica carinata TaxID=52824 RepID=A0A8X7PET0_BRACI|nr:hypothetical protein Bca52824_080707 [Brassica carinata]
MQKESGGSAATDNTPFQFVAAPSLAPEKEGGSFHRYQFDRREASGYSHFNRSYYSSGRREDRNRSRYDTHRENSYHPYHNRDKNRSYRTPLDHGRTQPPTKMQWRPRTADSPHHSRDRPHDSHHPTGAEDSSSPILPSPPVRGVPLRSDHNSGNQNSPQLQGPIERGSPLAQEQPLEIQNGLEKALGEVREAMHQYTLCADPAESAARKERMHQSEEQGEFHETAASMVQTTSENMVPQRRTRPLKS